MPDGLDVRPDALRRGAADLRADAGALESVRTTAGSAAQQAAGGAGTGPLAGAAHDLAAALDRAVNAVRRSLDESAAALDATALQYMTADAGSASRLAGVAIPGLAPPR